MKTISILSLFVCLLFSCSKNESLIKCDCSNFLPNEQPIVCTGSLCQNDTCNTYFEIWKTLFLVKNGMAIEYFNDHITPCWTKLSKWDSGISFEISYKVKIDWMEINLSDEFIIWLSSRSSGFYPSVSLPRNSLLNKDQISAAVNFMAFSSSLNSVSSVEFLYYNSLSDAKKAMNQDAHTDTLCRYEYYYEKPHKIILPRGVPFLKGHGTINYNENKCITTIMNLVTGKTEIQFNECYIIN